MGTIPDVLGVNQKHIAEFCRRRHIQWLAVFGSILRDDFGPDSDIDVLIEFEPGRTPGLAFFDLPDDLSPLFGGKTVDVGTKQGLSRWIRGRVLAEAKVLYDATR
jgi:predicted nucleotidyltransferase